jgi:hypothetical protein
LLVNQSPLELYRLGIYQHPEAGRLSLLMGGGCKSTGVVEDLFMLMCVARILEGIRGGVIHVRLMKRREAEDGSVEGSGDSRRGLNPLEPTSW